MKITVPGPDWKLLFLFISLMLLFVTYPIIEGSVIGEIVLDIITSLIVISSVFAVTRHTRQKKMLIVLALMTFLFTWLDNYHRSEAIVLTSVFLHIAYLVFIVIILLDHVLEDEDVNADKLIGSICVYLVIGIVFALFHYCIERLSPGAYTGFSDFADSKGVEHLRISEFIYFSFTTLTTTGFGDISPKLPLARLFSVIEMVSGQLYIAILVARLVALHIEHRRNRK